MYCDVTQYNTKQGETFISPCSYVYHLNFRVPQVVFDLDWASMLFQPCLLHEDRGSIMEIAEWKEDSEYSYDCFHLD